MPLPPTGVTPSKWCATSATQQKADFWVGLLAELRKDDPAGPTAQPPTMVVAHYRPALDAYKSDCRTLKLAPSSSRDEGRANVRPRWAIIVIGWPLASATLRVLPSLTVAARVKPTDPNMSN